MLSLGGDAYNEGGFTTADLATAGADKVWATFGPVQNASTAVRPFGTAVLDGFDFDFEANVSNMAVFGNRLRTLFAAAGGKKYFLSAAPQCRKFTPRLSHPHPQTLSLSVTTPS